MLSYLRLRKISHCCNKLNKHNLARYQVLQQITETQLNPVGSKASRINSQE